VTPDVDSGVFARVVLIPDESGRVRLLGFTSGRPVPGSTTFFCVFVPNAPNPIGGRLYFVPHAECRFLTVPTREALKCVVSGGNFVPEGIGNRCPHRPMKRKFWLGLLAFLASLPVGANPAPAQTPSAPFITPAQLKATLAGHKGRVVVLHLWATWCGPCLKELPLIAKLAREASSQGVDFLPVSLDDPTNRNAALVGRVLAAKTGDSQWSPILKADRPEDFVADLDPSWKVRSQPSFPTTARATCATPSSATSAAAPSSD